MLSEVEWLRGELREARERGQRMSAAIGYLESRSGYKLGNIDEWYVKREAEWNRRFYLRLHHKAASAPENNCQNDIAERYRVMKLVVG